MKKYFKILIIIIISALLIITYNVQAKEINTTLIYLDPGHGGTDSGGTSKNGIEEKNINLSVCKLLEKYLKDGGYEVLLTRRTDNDLAPIASKNRKTDDIVRRVDLINNSNAIIYVSIHCNIFPNQTIRGAQTFYNSNNQNNKILATEIQNYLSTVLQNTKRQPNSIKNKYLVDNVKKIGCLTEIGFLSNYVEEQLLNDINYQEKVAYAIYLGIIAYLNYNN